MRFFFLFNVCTICFLWTWAAEGQRKYFRSRYHHICQSFFNETLTPGAQTQGLRQDYGVLCVCVCVWVMFEWAEVGKDREKQGGQVKDTLHVALPSLSPLILSSRLPPPTDLESPSPSLHHYSVTLPPLAFPPLSSSPSLPCFLRAASIYWGWKNLRWAWVPSADSTVNKCLFLASTPTIRKIT